MMGRFETHFLKANKMKYSCFLHFLLAAASNAFSTTLFAANKAQPDLSPEEMSWYLNKDKDIDRIPTKMGEEQLKAELAIHRARAAKLQETVDKGYADTAKGALECEVDDPRVECMLSAEERKWFQNSYADKQDFDMDATLAELEQENEIIWNLESDVKALFQENDTSTPQLGLSEAEMNWFNGKPTQAPKAKMGEKELKFELAIHKARVAKLQQAMENGDMLTAKAALECNVDDMRVECMLSEIEQRWYQNELSSKPKIDFSKELAIEMATIVECKRKIGAMASKALSGTSPTTETQPNLSPEEMSWYLNKDKDQDPIPAKMGEEQLKAELAIHRARAAKLQETVDKGYTDTAKGALECEVDDPRVECMLSAEEQKWFQNSYADKQDFDMDATLAELEQENEIIWNLENKAKELIRANDNISKTELAAALPPAELGLSEAEMNWFNGKPTQAPKAKMGEKELKFELAIHKARVAKLQQAMENGDVLTAKAALECGIDDLRIECMLSEIEQRWYQNELSSKPKIDFSKELAIEMATIVECKRKIGAMASKALSGTSPTTETQPNLSPEEMSWYLNKDKDQDPIPAKMGEEQLKAELAFHRARAAKLQETVDKGYADTAKGALECEVDDPRVECMLSAEEQKWFQNSYADKQDFDMDATLAELEQENEIIWNLENEVKALFQPNNAYF